MSVTNFNPKRVRLCIAGSFGYMDIGDEAMLTEDLDYILNELHIPRANITLLGHLPDYVSAYHGHPLDNCLPSDAIVRLSQTAPHSFRAKLRNAARRLFKGPSNPGDVHAASVARRCDAFLVTGGGTINTRTADAYSLRRIHAMVMYFRKLGKPVFMSGQTVGPLGLDREHDDLARTIISEVDVLTARDRYYSRRYLNVLGVTPREFIETFDDAVSLPHSSATLPKEVGLLLKRGPTVAFNITDYTTDTFEKRVFLVSICEHLVRTRNASLLFLSHAPKDYFMLLSLHDMFDDALKDRILVPDTRNWQAAQLKQAISHCHLAYGGRYHFIVFAGTTGIPFVGYCGNHYSYVKQDGFARAIGCQRFILNERETWDRDTVIARLEEAWQRRTESRQFDRPGESMKRFGEWLRNKGRGRSLGDD